MGHDHQSTRRAGPAKTLVEVSGEEGDPLNVKVVGGLVEDDNAGVLAQRGRERDAPTLPTGQLVDLGIQPNIRKQALVEAAHMGIARPLVRGGTAVDRVEDSLPLIKIIGLREPRDASRPKFGDGAVVGNQLPGHDAQQGGFSTAVRADNANAVAVFETHRDVAENRAVAKGDTRALCSEKVCHRYASSLTSVTWAAGPVP